MKIATAALSMLAAAAFVAPAAAETLTFETNFTGPSYTEAGLTIAATATSAAPVIINGNFDLPCCTYAGQTAQYSLTTGGLFDLISIDVLHQDNGDPITFEGFLGATLINSAVIDGGFNGLFSFTGFTGLDNVLVTMNGSFNDPTFDNLVYQNGGTVPEPASWALMIAGFGLVGTTMRRRMASVPA